MRTVENLVKHELIGLETQIMESLNPQVIGLNGVVINETKSMIQLNTKNGIKKIPKNINKWSFSVNGQSVILDGNLISKRPQERLKIKA